MDYYLMVVKLRDMAEDLTGKTFNYWTVLKKSKRKDPHNHIIWICRCKCGTIKEVGVSNLKYGQSKSCGCFRVERGKELIKICHAKQPIQRGKDASNWQGGLTYINKAIRKLSKYKDWYLAVFERDNYKCQHCGAIGGKLHAHHIIFLSKLVRAYKIKTTDQAVLTPGLWDVTNGITLCHRCHKDFHVGTRMISSMARIRG